MRIFPKGSHRLRNTALGCVLASLSGLSTSAQLPVTTIRLGAFPNITHARPMVGKANGWFDKAMGPQVKVQWTSFTAGPSAIEALFAGAIDMTCVGPNLAINGYVRSNGEEDTASRWYSA